MSNADKLIALGAHSVAGDLIWKNKVLGSMRNGDFIPTEDGLALLEQDIEDAVIKTETKRTRKPKVDAPVVDTAELDVSDLLGDE